MTFERQGIEVSLGAAAPEQPITEAPETEIIPDQETAQPETEEP